MLCRLQGLQVRSKLVPHGCIALLQAPSTSSRQYFAGRHVTSRHLEVRGRGPWIPGVLHSGWPLVLTFKWWQTYQSPALCVAERATHLIERRFAARRPEVLQLAFQTLQQHACACIVWLEGGAYGAWSPHQLQGCHELHT